MVIFKDLDYKDLLYPAHTIKTGMSIFELFPTLLDYTEFHAKLPASLPISKVFKYIVFVYDHKSPFVTQIDNLEERKLQAVQEAGFKPEDDSIFVDTVQDMLNCKDPQINEMILRYCRLQGKDWPNIVASQEAFFQINLQLLSNIKTESDDAIEFAKKKAALDKAADEFNERLNEKARKFLVGETAQGLQDKLWSIAEDEARKVRITPEDYAD
jgi:hypothetical protein